MKPYAEESGLLSAEDIAMFYQIHDVVEELPRMEFSAGNGGDLVSCHLLARAIGKFFRLEVRDGYFANPGIPHSWLVNERGKIFDVYPVAQVGGPVLLDNFFLGPWPNLFVEQKIDGLISDEFVRRLLIVESVVEKTMQQLRLLPRPQEPFVWASRRGTIHARNAHMCADAGA